MRYNFPRTSSGARKGPQAHNVLFNILTTQKQVHVSSTVINPVSLLRETYFKLNPLKINVYTINVSLMPNQYILKIFLKIYKEWPI